MQSSPEIRPATPADIAALADLWHAGWHEAHAGHVPEVFTKLRSLESFLLRLPGLIGDTNVIVRAGVLSGFCMVKGREIYQIYVTPAARGGNVASALLADGETRIAADGNTRGVLHVIPENQRALAFYYRNGWAGVVVKEIALETLDTPFMLKCRVLEKDIGSVY